MDRTKLLTLAGYNTFFWVFFWLFCYWTFPYERVAAFLTDRVAASGAGYTLEIGELAPYWLTGVHLSDVKVRKVNPLGAPPAPAPTNGPAAAAKKPAADDAIHVRDAHARVGLLGLLFGSQSFSFDAVLEQGEIEGGYEEDGDIKQIDAKLSKIDLGKFGLLESAISLPVKGTLEGDFDLALAKQAVKSSGSVKIVLKDLTIGDGQAKVKMGGMGGLTLDPVNAGDVTLELDVKDGIGKIKKLSANGQDVSLNGSGEVRFADPIVRSRLDVLLSVNFTDNYRNKSDRTKAMFSLLDASGVPQVRAAKTPDGGLAFRVTGTLGLPRAVPAGKTSASRPSGPGRAMPVAAPRPSQSSDDEPE